MWKVITRSSGYEDDVPQILKDRSLRGIAEYIKSDACKQIYVMAGAGISTAAGIPDFRSPETGLYANLARLNLPYPEAVFDIGYFRRNPLPFYTLAHELAPGRFRPTLTHSFFQLLAKKGLLGMCFTQNIDTLERRAGLADNLIVEAHGSFADQHCIKCGAHYPHDKTKQKIETKDIPRCERSSCNGLVKPDIVFFGEALPERFHSTVSKLRSADLLIVVGTSLTVHPFASLTDLVPEDCPRLLINLDHVGNWGSRVNDVACLKKCDDAVRELCELLGWESELDELWETTADSLDVKPSPDSSLADSDTKEEGAKDEEAKLQDEVDKLAAEIDKALKLSNEHQSSVRQELEQKDEEKVEEAPEPRALPSGTTLAKTEAGH